MRAPADLRRVVVFSKPPLPGRVKTRLAPRLGLEGAARLHRAFLDDTLAALAGLRAELVLAWGSEPGEALPGGWRARARGQGEGDLGQRLARVVAEESHDGAAVVVVGSDHPELLVEVVEEALGRLADGSVDVILGPTSDGGYWLVGCRPDVDTARLFAETPWSTDRVLETTRTRAADLGLRCGLVATLDDIDTPADLERLIVRLEAGGSACPATRRALAEVAVVTP